MNYEMNLCHTPFIAIKSMKKTVEMRLYDERRQNIKIGDLITFLDLDTKNKITCKVESVDIFESFKDLYQAYDKTQLGYEKDEKCSYLDMLQYYSQEKQDLYKVMAIKIKLLE